jgi:transcriptional regulator with XRE-family HTH domain
MTQRNPEQVAPEPAGVAINGTQVRRARKLRGKTIKQFAVTCGISFQYLSQIERGDRKTVSPATFVRICDALGIHAENREELVLEEVPA